MTSRLRLRAIAGLAAIVAASGAITLGCARGSDSQETENAAGNGSAVATSDAPIDTAALEKAAADFAREVQDAIAAGASEGTWRFGQSDIECEELSASILNTNPSEYADVKVRVRGKVASVCQATGCWVQVEDTTGEKLFAKSFDHLVLMPKNCEGMTIDVVGTMYADPVEEGDEQTYSFSLDGATLAAAEGS